MVALARREVCLNDALAVKERQTLIQKLTTCAQDLKAKPCVSLEADLKEQVTRFWDEKMLKYYRADLAR